MKNQLPGVVAKKKVILIRNAYFYDFGGAERFPINLALELNKRDYSTIIVSSSPKLLAGARRARLRAIEGLWWARQSWSGIRVLLLPAYLVWQMFLSIWYLQLFFRLRPDIVHPQSRDDFIAATFAAKLLGKKVIWTDHADLKYVLANHRVWYKNPVGKLVFLASKLADAITLVSHDETRSIEKQLGRPLPPKYRVVHNSVPETAVEPIARSSSQKGSIVFCATSRLVTAKGIGELIEAFKDLKKTHSDAVLWLVGGGPEEKKYKAQAKNVDGIKFIGHSDNAPGYVAAADIFVHPSYHEGFSLSIVEAAMLAKPIIACDVGGNPEIIKNKLSGLLIPPRDNNALAEAMGELAANPRLRKKLGEAARRAYEQNFRFSTIVKDQFLPIYEEK